MKKLMLLSVLLLIAACASPAPQAVPQTTVIATGAETQQVSISNFHFTPQTMTVAVGDTVTWTNDDSTSHIVSIDGVESPELFKGDSWSHTFTAAGAFDYVCTIHPSMKGTITVQ